MIQRSRLTMLVAAVLLAGLVASAQGPAGTIAFTVSMDQPTTHCFHVVVRTEGLGGETLDFKMPAWTPGYYLIKDYARNVLDFRAADGAGRPLAWTKTATNTWRVTPAGAAAVVVSYDVYAFEQSVADSYLDDERAFISPTGVFMHVGGQIGHPATVTVRPYREWSRVSTGLDPVEGRPNVFTAPDFDVLYDSPILLGTQEVWPFEVRGVPHALVGSNLASLDPERFVADLKKIVEASADLMGEIPYRHYTFLVIGPGRGGLEHANSTALTFNPLDASNPAAYTRWLAFVAHEYFHLYNVKRIRPIALGPFDYDRANLTYMLWVAEGFTVYYEDVVLNRAGLLSRDECLDRARGNIARYEDVPGHLFQSAAQSSFDTWLQFFSRGPATANTTISYYDKGAVLAMLLDLRIRHETAALKSLDDVMRALYQTYYKEKKRGYTDEEFRAACEQVAGVSLSEFFEDYAASVKDVDYAKSLAYGGFDIDLEPRALPGGYLGVQTQDRNGAVTISLVEWDSPAWRAGLSVQDEILAVDGVRVAPLTFGAAIGAKKPGDRIRVLVSRRNAVREIEATLDTKSERTFKITPMPNPSPLQATIRSGWMNGGAADVRR